MHYLSLGKGEACRAHKHCSVAKESDGEMAAPGSKAPRNRAQCAETLPRATGGCCPGEMNAQEYISL